MLGWGLPWVGTAGKGTKLEGNAEPMLSGKPVSCAVYNNDVVAAAVSHVQVWD